jgi:glycosyltransferase involved in cell wall biosynthesis
MTPRVLLVTGSAPPDPCGVGDYTALLASALQGAGLGVEVFCQRDWTLSGSIRALKKLVLTKDSLVHMQYPTMGFKYSLGPQLSMVAKQGIVTVHEFSLAHPLRKLSLLPFTLRSQRIVVTSEFELDAIARSMPWVHTKLRMIPIGSNISQTYSAYREREDLVVYFGLIMPRKGLEDFIEFARLLRARNPNWKLLIIGKVATRQETYAKSLMASAAPYGVQWILDSDPEDAAKLLAKAGLGYFPFPDGASDRRGSLKAALTAGLPCITTFSEQTPTELAHIVALCATPQDAVEEAVRLMGAKDERLIMSEGSRRYSLRFSWERIAALHIQMYRELLGV